MPKERLTDHMKQRYEQRLKEFVEALRDNVDYPLAAFCREKEIEVRSFTSWLSIYKQQTPLEIRNKVRVSLGMKPLTARGQLAYDKHLKNYRDMLAIDLDYEMTQYCKDVGISAHGFHHWIMRQGLTVDKIREEVCETVGIEPDSKKSTKPNRSQRKATEPSVFRKAIAGYRKMLESDSSITLQKFCRAKGYAYRPLLHWMYEVGIKPADIKAFVLDRQKLPKDNRRVFIQFKPNGGSKGDVFNGVRISLPDGTQIDVESCTVVGLCSFVNIYSKQE